MLIISYRHAMLAAAVVVNLAWAADESAPQYVVGSWVNVRAQAAADGAVIDQIIVNTPVRLANAAAGNGFCEIGYGADKRGFVACRLLGEKPLSLLEVDTPEINGKSNPAYSATRAFWIQPSVDRLLAAGQYFESTMLKPRELEAERKAAKESGGVVKVRRFPIPEFEAMKAQLKSGVMGSLADPPTLPYGPFKLNYQSMPKWADIKAIVGSAKNNADFYNALLKFSFVGSWSLRNQPGDFFRLLELPPIKKSHFREVNQVISPDVMPETASSLFGIPYMAVVKGTPSWVPPGHYSGDDPGYIFGAWDVGAIETHLVSPIRRHTVHSDGTLHSESSSVPGGRFPPPDTDGYNDCKEGFAWGESDKVVNHPPLFYYFSKHDLPRKKATVNRKKSKFPVAGFIGAETFRFDVDGDGVDDIVVWVGTRPPDVEAINPPELAQADYRVVFFNIAGEWHLLLVDVVTYSCGC